jgi:hypothetical protein
MRLGGVTVDGVGGRFYIRRWQDRLLLPRRSEMGNDRELAQARLRDRPKPELTDDSGAVLVRVNEQMIWRSHVEFYTAVVARPTTGERVDLQSQSRVPRN